MPPTHTPTIHPMSIKGISMFLYRKQIFVILPFHFSWLNWVRKCCSISANFCIVYSCSTFRPSDHAYCQLYQFNSLTFHPFWQFHSMESNRSSSSINSYTFSSIGPGVANSTSQKNQEKFTQLANICFVPFQCIVSFLENFLVQTAPLNLSVIPLLSSYLSIWLIPFSHNFHAIIPWIPSVPSITQFQFYQFKWL